MYRDGLHFLAANYLTARQDGIDGVEIKRSIFEYFKGQEKDLIRTLGRFYAVDWSL